MERRARVDDAAGFCAAFLSAGAFFTRVSSAEAAKTASVIFDYDHSLFQ